MKEVRLLARGGSGEEEMEKATVHMIKHPCSYHSLQSMYMD